MRHLTVVCYHYQVGAFFRAITADLVFIGNRQSTRRNEQCSCRTYTGGKSAPYSTITTKNSDARDRLDATQEEIIQALPEEKRSLIDASQDAYMELVMDEGEAAFAEGVAFGVKLMMEIGGTHECEK